MALDKAVDSLKKGSKEDKVAIASGISITVVVMLLVGWAILFFHKIQNGTQQVQLSGGVQDQFNFTSVKEAQQQLQDTYNNVNQDLQDLRNQAVSNGQSAQPTPQPAEDSTDQFTNPTPTN